MNEMNLGVRITIYLTSKQRRQLKLASIEQEKTMSKIITELVDKYIPQLEIKEVETTEKERIFKDGERIRL